MYTSWTLVLLTASSILPRATPAPAPASCSLPPEPHISYTPPPASSEASVHRLFNITGFGFENLGVRANGQILATAAFGPSAQLWQIDPLSIQQPILLREFPTFTSTLGVTELQDDMFYVIAQNESQPGTGSIFSVNMRPFLALPDGTIAIPPGIKKVAHLAGSVELNGLTHIPGAQDFVFSADTALGGVWRTDVATGASTLIIKDPTMNGPPNTTSIASFGINGIRIQNKTLFYCNSGQQTLHGMPIHANGSSAGKARLITSKVSCDDFTVDLWGFLYVASPSNALLRVDPRTGSQLVVAGKFNSSSSDIISGSSAQFGRGVSDSSSVYITTNGGSFTCPPPGSQGISRVDVGDLAQVLG